MAKLNLIILFMGQLSICWSHSSSAQNAI